MAHKKAGGSSRNGRDSKPKMLGVKRYGGEFVRAGRDSTPRDPKSASSSVWCRHRPDQSD